MINSRFELDSIEYELRWLQKAIVSPKFKFIVYCLFVFLLWM